MPTSYAYAADAAPGGASEVLGLAVRRPPTGKPQGFQVPFGIIRHQVNPQETFNPQGLDRDQKLELYWPRVLDKQGVHAFRKAMYLYLDLKNRFTGPDPYPDSDPRDFQMVHHYLALTIQDEMLRGPSMGLAYLATWAATLQNVDIDLGVFLIGELTLTGHLPAAGDMQAKLLAAAEFVDAMGYEKGYVIFPMANVAGLQVVEANGEDVKLPRRLRDKLVLLPAERELDALKMIFGDRFTIPPEVNVVTADEELGFYRNRQLVRTACCFKKDGVYEVIDMQACIVRRKQSDLDCSQILEGVTVPVDDVLLSLNGVLRHPAPLRNPWNQVKAGHPTLANVHFADTVDDRFDVIADFGGAGPRVTQEAGLALVAVALAAHLNVKIRRDYAFVGQFLMDEKGSLVLSHTAGVLRTFKMDVMESLRRLNEAGVRTLVVSRDLCPRDSDDGEGEEDEEEIVAQARNFGMTVKGVENLNDLLAVFRHMLGQG